MRRLLTAMAVLLIASCGGASPSPRPTRALPTPLPRGSAPLVVGLESDDPDVGIDPSAETVAAIGQLLAEIPASIAPGCAAVPPDGTWTPGDGETVRVTCDLPDGSDAVLATYARFSDTGAMDAAFDRAVGRSGSTTDGPGCERGPTLQTDALARVVCYADGDRATVVWTDELTVVLVTASRDDLVWSRLDRFRRTAGPIIP